MSDTQSNCLALGGHKHNLFVDLDPGLIAQQPRNHKLGTVADGVDGAILDHDAFVGRKKGLERADDAAEVGLVLSVVVGPLGVEDVVHRHHIVLKRDARKQCHEIKDHSH